LIRHDFKAVAYVVSGFIGRPGYMNAAQVREADHADIEIGSHTVDHADLTRQSIDGLRFEVTNSKRSLEQLLQHDVMSFCYPSGQVNAVVMAAVQEAGYWNATTTRLGLVRSMDGRFLWGRLRVSGGESLSLFAGDVVRLS
jgi:peptidoglycan/xylan/chitin deacetylase (PgdA/CDA1 family)